MRGAGKTPAQTGEQGLFRLVYQAHEVYKAEVLTHRKCYRRFMLDFIHSTQYHDATDAWSKNEHQKNYCIVSELLENHEKLVCQYFSQSTLDETQIKKLLDTFNTSEHLQTKSRIQSFQNSRQSEQPPLPDSYEPLIDKDTIGLIVQLVNEVGLFIEQLDVNDVITRYEKAMLNPVTSKTTHGWCCYLTNSPCTTSYRMTGNRSLPKSSLSEVLPVRNFSISMTYPLPLTE